MVFLEQVSEVEMTCERALVIMNGVPNSPINRYFQVVDSEASNNTYINCDHIQLCAGSDAERSATPQNTVVNNNLFYHDQKKNLFTVYDDISGISFAGNVLSEDLEPLQTKGFSERAISLQRTDDGLLLPAVEIPAGMRPHGERATPENTGVTWYPRVEQEVFFRTGKVIPVEAGTNTLVAAVKQSSAGDIIELSSAAEYRSTKFVDIPHPLTFRAARNLSEKPVLTFEKSALFTLANGGALTLEGLVIDGGECPDYSGNAVVRTSRYSMINNYKFFVEDCDFRDLDVNHSFEVLKVYKNTFADSIVLRNSTFSDVSGSVLSLNKETDDVGIYNAENVVIENCQFQNIGFAVLDLHRGGRDESTFGPMLRMNGNSFKSIGHDKRNRTGASVALHGVQIALLDHNQFKNSQPIKLHMVVGEPITRITNIQFTNTPKIIANDEPYVTENIDYN